MHEAIIRQFVTVNSFFGSLYQQDIPHICTIVRYSCNLTTSIEYWQISIFIKILPSYQKQCAHIIIWIIDCTGIPLGRFLSQLITDQFILSCTGFYFTLPQQFIHFFSFFFHGCTTKFVVVDSVEHRTKNT